MSPDDERPDDERPGAECFYAGVDGGVACTVHCEFFPCESSGRPASALPVHMGDDAFAREALLQMWRATTGGLRTLVIHHGGEVQSGHRVDRTGRCWCDPETVAPDPVPVPR